MKLIRGICNLNKLPYECALTIGNFDGVHIGHQALLKQMKKESKIKGLPVVVMIFEPQPLELFAGRNAPARLTNLREKLYHLAQYDIDYVLCVHFNWRFAAITAQDFINDLLINRLGMRFLVIGDDFRFGMYRQGSFFLLKEASKQYGFKIFNIESFCKGGVRISSTLIRQVLAKGELKIAENFLGHPLIISGRVIHGEKLGQKIGFPTANLSLHRQVTPIKGVYIVEVTGINKMPLVGIANIGTRPTIAGTNQLLEVHLLDVVINLYGRYINVVIRKKIRNEQRFSSINELKIQIKHDELQARIFFNLPSATNIKPKMEIEI